VKQVTKAVGIQKKFMYISRQTYATHLLEDGMDIITLKDLWDIRTLNFCPNPIFMWFYFTDSINPLAMHQPKIVYDTLFETTWETLQQFSKTKEIQAGKIAVLHTWGQQLSLHLHLHCIVLVAELIKSGNGKTAEGTVNFFPVKPYRRF
jgi:hypothetical protein